jgi:serine-type D-Ala-D-Ala carboxypeptidase/endopeptidase
MKRGRGDGTMGLGWVVLQPEGNRPLILEKSGGLQGMFSSVAFAPSRGVGVFVAIDDFNVGGFDAMSKAAIELTRSSRPDELNRPPQAAWEVAASVSTA